MTYTFDENIVSDLYKDVHGFRPTQDWWAAWDNQPDDCKEGIWLALLRELDYELERERQQTAEALREFNQWVNDIIECFGAKDRTQALRWMTGPNTFYNRQDVEHWVWEQGILFTDEGRALVKELMNIVKFEEHAY